MDNKTQSTSECKLELRHLAPYFPYGLKMAHGDFIGTLLRLDHCGLFRVTCSDWNEHIVAGKYKPMLRPMSDLTKEQLREAGFHCHVDFLTHEKRDLVGTPDRVGAPFVHLQYLFANHFDVFGLIDAGLAIDINSINSTAVE